MWIWTTWCIFMISIYNRKNYSRGSWELKKYIEKKLWKESIGDEEEWNAPKGIKWILNRFKKKKKNWVLNKEKMYMWVFILGFPTTTTTNPVDSHKYSFSVSQNSNISSLPIKVVYHFFSNFCLPISKLSCILGQSNNEIKPI